MNKILSVGLIGSVILSGMLFGADFSKQSNKELINLAGTVEPKDMMDYRKEIEKRIDEMTMKEAREFRTQIKEQATKAYDNMKVKDFKARQKAIMETMRENNRGGCMPNFREKGGPRGGGQGPNMGGHMPNMEGQMPFPPLMDNDPRSSIDADDDIVALTY